jgi:hypothetical protein
MNKEEKVRVGLAAVLALITVAALGYMVRIAWAQPTIALPFATVTSVGASSVQIIGANPSRRSIQICLPAVAATFTIAPAPITPVASTLGIAMTSTATITGPLCFTPPTNVLSGGSAGGAGAAWNAIASAAGPFNVIVLEW